MRRRCGEGCSSGSGSNTVEYGTNPASTHMNQTPHHTLELSRTSLGKIVYYNIFLLLFLNNFRITNYLNF